MVPVNRVSTGSSEAGLPAGDLLALTHHLVSIPSVSFEEQAICAAVEKALRAVPWLSVHREGDNLVARTELGHSRRLLLAGHLDTVPSPDGASARLEGNTVWGLGSADMKGGLAVMLELARTVPDPAIDLTYVFYSREEVAGAHSGLGELFELKPELLQADAAILGEPTSGTIEAGCQGTLRLKVTLYGTRAHTARGWFGSNAIHRMGPLLVGLSCYDERRPVIEGCKYREGLHAVDVRGGIGGNVVPDRVEVVINYRFAPDRTPDQAEAHIRAFLSEWIDTEDEVELVEMAGGALPGLDNPLLARLVALSSGVSAKLGWTDVARFAAAGIPATNLGPGQSLLAHSSGEHVSGDDLENVYTLLRDVVRTGL